MIKSHIQNPIYLFNLIRNVMTKGHLFVEHYMGLNSQCDGLWPPFRGTRCGLEN
jgi:hypothetical protein